MLLSRKTESEQYTEDFEVHSHGKTSEVYCQDCCGTGKELGRWTQDPKQLSPWMGPLRTFSDGVTIK